MGYDKIEVERSAEFVDWLNDLADHEAYARIEKRLLRLAGGNMGDWKALGDGVCELRIDAGPGYRIYFSRWGRRLVLLLCGGDKSTQRADIEAARRIRRAYPWQ